MTSTASSLERAVTEATILVHEIDALDVKEAASLWRLADLTAEHTPLQGGTPESRARTERHGFDEWAEMIGWTQRGRTVRSLKDMVTISRSWPKEKRVETATFWQHREARDHFGGDIEQASAWLGSVDRPKSVRDVTRSGIMGTGPIFDAIRALVRARKAINRVPAILAASNALGTEPNFEQLRDEVKRLERGMAYLNRYLADEVTIDMDEIQRGLDEILGEAA